MSRKNQPLSSKDLLHRLGLGDDQPDSLLQDEPLDSLLDDLDGDLGAVLRARQQQMQVTHAFKPGDLVRWKPGLANRRCPRNGTPAVVMEVLDPPIMDNAPESGSTYFREPLSLVIGLIWDRNPNRGDFVTFHVDGRRFEPWTQD
ncbi:hypothetical protein [uncultured Thiohalocapsa sp.]|uniref:hypothetical protein n=1 Tax=uncultured Thiohalocapsa sp. TaxID=768990 RepID=UPI0025ECFAB3|nr:hypothetical protein [uncultured Thiohalocapsa sp.]